MSHTPSAMPPYTEAQRREAADWFVVVHAECDPMAESIQAWLKWMDQDAGNRAAFDAVARAWHGLPGSSALQMPSAGELLADAYDGAMPVDHWLASQSTARGASASAVQSGARHAYRTRRAWLAAAAVVIAMAGVAMLYRYLNLRGLPADEFATRTGERIEMTLADGSRVWLSPRSRLGVEFSPARRAIQLRTGEAFFSVTKDSRRPFVVRLTGGEITAVGTAFNVRAAGEHVTVAVSEGVVTVMPKSQRAVSAPQSVRVATGQQLTFTGQQPIKASAITQSPAPGERARWRDGVLIYRDEPLREVVSDVGRYCDIQLDVADAAVGELHFSGVVYQGAVNEWISALPESFPVTIVADGARVVIKAR